jgi:hypothetical protein
MVNLMHVNFKKNIFDVYSFHVDRSPIATDIFYVPITEWQVILFLIRR